MGLLVRSLWRRGVDAHGLDVSERVIEAHRKTWPDRFHLGSAVALPFEAGAFDTVVSTSCLEHLTPTNLATAVGEFTRVARRGLFLTVSTAPDPEHPWRRTVRPRAWWETLFVEAGFRRHPRMLAAVPFVGLEDEPWQIPLVFEIDPAGCEAGESDWGKRGDREADAYLAFYDLSGKFVREGYHVVDWACDSGFGSAVLAAGVPGARVTGFGEPARVSYATRHYGPTYPNLTFRAVGADGWPGECDSADVVVVHGPQACAEGRVPWEALTRAAAIVRPGGVVIARLPAGPAAVTDAATFTAGMCDVREYACPPVPGLSVRHIYAATWAQVRDQREIKLPLTQPPPDADAWVVVYQKEVNGANLPAVDTRRDKVVILAHHHSGSHYAALLDQCPFPVEFESRFGVDWTPPPDAGLVVSLELYDEPGVSAIRRAVEAGVPTLVLADGILEFRNTWQHPQNVPGALMQPVIGHKVACIGPSQARILESWGNYGRCEVVGAPRFDQYVGLRHPPRSDGPLAVLVATAKTPYFTPDQRAQVVEALEDLRSFFARDAESGSPAYRVSWRISPDLARDLGLGAGDRRAAHEAVIDAVREAEALITTPSTLMVEGMLAGLPVAVLDYGNAPAYYSAAWRISASRHIPDVLRGLRAPSGPEWLYQEYALHDMCACATPAAPRLIALMARMIECGRNARAANAPLSFPARILAADPAAVALPDNAFDTARLYPDAAHVKRTHVAALQYEVAQLRRVIASRESDLNRFDRALKSFDADVRARHDAVAAFEKELLAFKEELARRETGMPTRDRWWFPEHQASLSLPGLLSRFVASLPEGRPVYCWGAGEMGRRLLAALGTSAARIDALLDGSAGRPAAAWGKPVVDPAALWDVAVSQRPFVLIATVHATMMVADLEAHGYRPAADFVCVPALEDMSS
jgi:hypothetical protein